MITLNNKETTAGFPGEGAEGARIEGGPCAIVEVTVTGKPVIVQFKLAQTKQSGQAAWTQEVFMQVTTGLPRVFQLVGIFGVQARSAEAEAGKVSFVMLAEDEIWTPPTPTPIVQQLVTQPVKELNTNEAAGILATAA
jgi:hypothetical protein